MQMDNSLVNSMNELINLERQQLQRLNDMSTQQAEQVNMQRQTNLRSGGGAFIGVSPQNFMPPGMGAENISRQYQQFGAHIGGLSGSGSKYGFVDTFMPINGSSISRETRDAMTLDYAGRSANAFISGTGAVASTVATLGAYKMGGLITGSVMGAVAGAGVSAFFDNSLEEAKKQQSYTKYLQRESYRFINPSESNNDRGFGGFSLKESQQAANFMRTVNSDMYINDNEMMSLLQKYTESGMLRDVNDLDTFKDRIKSLTKSVKEGALMLNETYESISDLIADMRKMGITENQTQVMSMGKVLGMDLGKSGSEVVRTLLGMSKGMVEGTGLSGEHYFGRMSDTVTFMNYMYEDLFSKENRNAREDATLNYIRNNGGAENVSMMVNQIQDNILYKSKDVAASFFDYNENTKTWELNSRKFNDISSGRYSIEEMANEGKNNMLKHDPLVIKDWQDNFKIYLGNQLNQTEISKFTKSLASGYNRSAGADPQDLSMGLSLMNLGLSSEQRELYSSYMNTVIDEGDNIIKQQEMMATAQKLSASIRANNPTIGERIKYGWEDVKEGVGSLGASVSNFFGTTAQKINDKIYGKQFYNLDFMHGLDMSEQAINNAGYKMYDEMNKSRASLSELKDSGFNISEDLINALTVSDPRELYYKYRRDVISNGAEVFGADKYKEISGLAKEGNLSETIVAALSKFSSSSEGKRFFGASEEIISKLKNDPSNLSSQEQLKLAVEKISELVHLYGGNEGLAMSAFFNGQTSVDQQLKMLGYDVDKLREKGYQGDLANINYKTLNLNNEKSNNFEEYRTGYSPSTPGVKYDVVGGEGTVRGADPVYSDSYDYVNDKNLIKGKSNYYDLVHYVGEQTGLSANVIATTMATESSGVQPTEYGRDGEIGLMQVIPKFHWKELRGLQFERPDGTTYTMGDSEEQIDKDLWLEDVNLFAGAHLMKKYMDEFDNNPMLAYGKYNGGGGFIQNLQYAVNQDHHGMKDIRDLTEEEFFHYAAKVPNKKGELNVVGKHVGNFMDAYYSGLTVPDEVLKERDTSITTIYENKYMDSLSKGKEVIKGVSDLDKIDRSKTSGISSGTLSELHKIYSAYEKEGSNMERLTPNPRMYLKRTDLGSDEYNDLLYKAYSDITGETIPSELNMGQRARLRANMSDWYKETYKDMVDGGGKFSNLSLTGKLETMRFMEILSASDLMSGLDLPNMKAITTDGRAVDGKKLGKILGKDTPVNLFTEDELNILSHINKDGVYDEGSRKVKDKDKYERALNWIDKGAPINYASLATQQKNKAKELVSGYSGSDVIQKASDVDNFKKLIDTEMKSVDKQIREAEDDTAKLISSIRSGDVAKEFSKDNREKLITAMITGDTDGVRDLYKSVRGPYNRYDNNDYRKVIDLTKKISTSETLKDSLSAQEKLVDDMFKRGETLAGLANSISSYVPQIDEKSLKSAVNYNLISDSKKLEKHSPVAIDNILKGSLKGIEEAVHNVISEDMNEFINTINQTFGPSMTDEYLKSFNIKKEDGKYKMVLENGEKLAEKQKEMAEDFVALVTVSTDESRKTLSEIEEPTKNFVEAAEKLTDAVGKVSKGLEETADVAAEAYEKSRFKLGSLIWMPKK